MTGWSARFCPAGRSPARPGFNDQIRQFLLAGNARVRRALGCAPADRITADKTAMLELPPVPPATGWRSHGRLARDHYVRLDSNDYSVHPSAIGRRIEVTADLHRVTVTCEGRRVASHRRAWCWHQTFTDPAHLAAAADLRRQHVSVVRPAREAEVQVRPLADYDAALGLDGDGMAAS